MSCDSRYGPNSGFHSTTAIGNNKAMCRFHSAGRGAGKISTIVAHLDLKLSSGRLFTPLPLRPDDFSWLIALKTRVRIKTARMFQKVRTGNVSRDLNGVLGLLQFRKSRRRSNSAKPTSDTNLPSTSAFAICVNPEALHATSLFPETRSKLTRTGLARFESILVGHFQPGHLPDHRPIGRAQLHARPRPPLRLFPIRKDSATSHKFSLNGPCFPVYKDVDCLQFHALRHRAHRPHHLHRHCPASHRRGPRRRLHPRPPRLPNRPHLRPPQQLEISRMPRHPSIGRLAVNGGQSASPCDNHGRCSSIKKTAWANSQAAPISSKKTQPLTAITVRCTRPEVHPPETRNGDLASIPKPIWPNHRATVYDQFCADTTKTSPLLGPVNACRESTNYCHYPRQGHRHDRRHNPIRHDRSH